MKTPHARSPASDIWKHASTDAEHQKGLGMSTSVRHVRRQTHYACFKHRTSKTRTSEMALFGNLCSFGSMKSLPLNQTKTLGGKRELDLGCTAHVFLFSVFQNPCTLINGDATQHAPNQKNAAKPNVSSVSEASFESFCLGFPVAVQVCRMADPPKLSISLLPVL